MRILLQRGHPCTMDTFLVWYATWPCSEKVEVSPFDPTPGSWGWCLRANICYHVAAFVIPFNSICNMTIFRKSLILTSPLGTWVFCGQNICYHVAADVIPLIWYATWSYSEKVEFSPLPHPLSPPRGSDPGLLSKITFWVHVCFIFTVPLHAKFQ